MKIKVQTRRKLKRVADLTPGEVVQSPNGPAPGGPFWLVACTRMDGASEKEKMEVRLVCLSTGRNWVLERYDTLKIRKIVPTESVIIEIMHDVEAEPDSEDK